MSLTFPFVLSQSPDQSVDAYIYCTNKSKAVGATAVKKRTNKIRRSQNRLTKFWYAWIGNIRAVHNLAGVIKSMTLILLPFFQAFENQLHLLKIYF